MAIHNKSMTSAIDPIVMLTMMIPYDKHIDSNVTTRQAKKAEST